LKKLVPLFLVIILVYVTCQNASAYTISAIPQQQEFGANDWIKINLDISGYNGGPINWVAHRPDNSTISGIVDSQVRGEQTVHQIERSAFDNEFGPWSINYQYGGINQTVNFKVNSLSLAVFTDKVTYYESDTMNINITSAYYEPNDKYAQSIFLDFYDRNGNLAEAVSEIEVRAEQHSTVYHFPMFLLSDYNPPGLYKLKVKYFNSVIEVPFLLGDIRKLMEITTQTSPTYYQGSDVTIDTTFTRLTQTTATLKITDPLGNTTSNQYSPRSVHDTLVLRNFSKEIGTYKYEINYAGATGIGSFNVIKNPQELPNIRLVIFPDKLNYRPGEIIHFKIYASHVITDSIDVLITNPDGITSQRISFPVNTTETIIPHKIGVNDSIGEWKINVNYDGIERSSSFNVVGSAVQSSEILDPVQYEIPTFVSTINSTTFNSPKGIAIDSDNSTYIVDSGNSQVKKFDKNGNLLLTWGDVGTSIGQFKNPSGIFVNEKYVYVVDTGNSRINMYNKTGDFVYSWGTYGENPGMFQMPVSINSNQNGELFVGDIEKKSIQLFDTKGTYSDQIDSSLLQGESFLGISALAFDSEDNLYAVSTDNRILKFSNNEEFLNFFGSRGSEEGWFNKPSGIAIDSKNDIYVADTNNHRIQKFDSNGNFLLSWGTEGTGQGQFEEPVGLATDKADNIYVVDKKNNNVQKFSLYGRVNNSILPNWIKNTAIWWSEGALDKKDFSQAIRYVIDQGLITAPSINQDENVKIPNWVKGNVKQWSSGQIDDETFWASIQHLISVGIMKV
jgi:uncharacterized protein YjiK